MSIKVKLLALKFVTDHPPLRKNDTAGGVNALTEAGSEIKYPHWKKDPPSNHPVSYSKAQKVKVVLTLGVIGSGSFRLQGKSDGRYLNFGPVPFKQNPTAGTRDSSPPAIKIIKTSPIEATDSLPDYVTKLTESITWSAIEAGNARDVQRTGPHEVFVLCGKPQQENSIHMTNYFTYQRLKLLTAPIIAGNKRDVDDIATAIHQYVNRKMNKGGRNIDYTSGDGAQFWAMLGGTKRGHCGEATYLMEMMNRLLGIPAKQVHVRPATTAASLVRLLNLKPPEIKERPNLTDEQKKKLENELEMKYYETRECAIHKTEVLKMTFGYMPPNDQCKGETYKIQEGEGTCEVNGKLYPGLINNMIGTANSGRSAAQDLLVKLEERYAPHLRRSRQDPDNYYRDDRLLVWITLNEIIANCAAIAT
jgi:hypothetical protein